MQKNLLILMPLHGITAYNGSPNHLFKIYLIMSKDCLPLAYQLSIQMSTAGPCKAESRSAGHEILNHKKLVPFLSHLSPIHTFDTLFFPQGDRPRFTSTQNKFAKALEETENNVCINSFSVFTSQSCFKVGSLRLG